MQCFPMGYSKVTVSNRRQAKQEVPEEKETTTTTSSSSSYSWNDVFIFARRRGKSDIDLYSALDIMGICTPCAFEASAGDV